MRSDLCFSQFETGISCSGAIVGRQRVSLNSQCCYIVAQSVYSTLVVVKNYTGDVLQFGLSKERFSALQGGSDSIRMVVVGEDVAVGREQGGIVGRRGLAATVLVYKIAGALAAQG